MNDYHILLSDFIDKVSEKEKAMKEWSCEVCGKLFKNKHGLGGHKAR